MPRASAKAPKPKPRRRCTAGPRPSGAARRSPRSARVAAQAEADRSSADAGAAAHRANDVHRLLADLRQRRPGGVRAWAAVAVVAALLLGYLWGSRPHSGPGIAEPLQLRLERSL